MRSHLPYVWDYQIDENEFQTILKGERKIGRLDRDWAAVRLLEYAPYGDIIQKLSLPALADSWPQWRNKIRSQSRKRDFDFLLAWQAGQQGDSTENRENVQNIEMAISNQDYYLNQLYPFQDEVLQLINQIEPPAVDEFVEKLHHLGEALLLVLGD